MNTPSALLTLSPSVALSRGAEAKTVPTPHAVHHLSTAEKKTEWTEFDCGPFKLLFSRRLPCVILPLANVCRVPNAKPCLLGAISVQGFVTPVFDLTVACGFTVSDNLRYLIVFGQDDERIALASMTLPLKISSDVLTPIRSAPALPPPLNAAVRQTYFNNDIYLFEMNAEYLFQQLADDAFNLSLH